MLVDPPRTRTAWPPNRRPPAMRCGLTRRPSWNLRSVVVRTAPRLNAADADFCSKCGQRLTPPPSAAGQPGAAAQSPASKAKRPNGCVGCVIVVVVLIVLLAIVGALTGGGSGSSNSGSSTSRSTGESGTRERAAPRPKSRQQLKRGFLATVDESISGGRINGNPYKFVGKNVDLHCVVESVPDENALNAVCPPDEYGLGPIIVVETQTRGLEKGQHIRVIGTVQDPVEGTNAMGGTMKFPTVKAEFME